MTARCSVFAVSWSQPTLGDFEKDTSAKHDGNMHSFMFASFIWLLNHLESFSTISTCFDLSNPFSGFYKDILHHLAFFKLDIVTVMYVSC